MTASCRAPPPELPVDPHSKSATPDPTAAAQHDARPSSAEPLPSSQPGPGKLTSPPPMSISITPPPSSQPRASRPSLARTPTPQTPHLSSPPPTLKNAAQLDSLGSASDYGIPSVDHIESADVEELRTMVNELCAALRESRLSAAHYKLQYSMLSMESQETQNRMAVELGMAQREVEVYQEAEARRRRESSTPAQHVGVANVTLLHEMSRHCSLLQQDNEELQDRLAQTLRSAESRDSEISALLERNEQLRERIRKNREHMNGFIDYVHEHSPQSMNSTPHHQTPRFRPHARTGLVHNSSQQGLFDTLLLADKVLSTRETGTAPSTPTRGKKIGHRAVHSMSSLPSTPQRSKHMTGASILQTPPSFAPINEAPRTVPAAIYATQRRRPSSDSTVTASSVDDDIPESQASQAATGMLRRASQKSSGPSQNASFNSHGGSGSQSKMKQTKLFGQITKPGVRAAAMEQEKRRISDHTYIVGPHGSPTKKARLGDAVGLGIGLDRRV